MINTAVEVNGVPVPLLFVHPQQINAQLPFEIRPGRAVMTIRVGGSERSVEFAVSETAPGLLVDGNGFAVTTSYGRVLSAYLTGQGPVNPSVRTGYPAPVDPLAAPALPIQAAIGGQPARVLGAALIPGYVGILQVNIELPQTLPLDRANTIQLGVGGQATNIGWLKLGF